MLSAFLHGFCFAAGALAAVLAFFLILGATDKNEDTMPPGVKPGLGPNRGDKPEELDISRVRARIRKI